MHRFCTTIDNLESISHQIAKVLRMRIGEHIVLFSGEDDMEYEAEITSLSPLQVKIISERSGGRDISTPLLTVYISPPKKPALIEEMIQKLSEVGVHKVVFFESERCEFKGNLKTDRLGTIVKEAAEQSGRTHLLQYEKHLIDFDTTLTQLASYDRSFVGAIDGRDLHEVLSETRGCRSMGLMIGPEGGLSEAELIRAADASVLRLTIPGPVMRVATASVALSSLLLHN